MSDVQQNGVKPELLNTYNVVFYDNKPVSVEAINFTVAGILAMAHSIQTNGAGFGIRYVENTLTGVRVPVDIK